MMYILTKFVNFICRNYPSVTGEELQARHPVVAETPMAGKNSGSEIATYQRREGQSYNAFAEPVAENKPLLPKRDMQQYVFTFSLRETLTTTWVDRNQRVLEEFYVQLRKYRTILHGNLPLMGLRLPWQWQHQLGTRLDN